MRSRANAIPIIRQNPSGHMNIPPSIHSCCTVSELTTFRICSARAWPTISLLGGITAAALTLKGARGATFTKSSTHLTR
ncbi:MAG: hypothetical protein BWY06_02099 [Candidatus Latescibacteria bacterium ADurb.Bin168]|nr:MAG: hypothetical protein BWY06_02099 [Candidatus Latescibacteria bacterium ADurb.Bin168]